MGNCAGMVLKCGVLALCAVAGTNCGGSAKGAATTPDTATSADSGLMDTGSVQHVDSSLCDVEGKTVTTFDLNRDNRPDVWKLYAATDEAGTVVNVLTCKQVDYDHDGTKDYVQIYSRTGDIIAEKVDLGFKGRTDSQSYYDQKTGKLYLVERNTDHDAQIDVWEKYDENEKLESVRRDRNADGKPDLWEQYKDGVLVAILFDKDFDGKVDRRDEIHTPTQAPPVPPTEAAEEPATETPVGPIDELDAANKNQ